MYFMYNAMRLCQAYGIALLCFGYYIGDSPARAFEAFNQINGNYPCSCGQTYGVQCTVAHLDVLSLSLFKTGRM